MLAAAYAVPSWEPETLRLYANALDDLDGEALKAAALVWIRTRRERPSVAEIRELVAEQQAETGGTPYLSPSDAWAWVERCVARIGSYGEFPPDHPLVADVVHAMGWRTLCMSDNAAADRAHFLKLYTDRLARAKRQAAAADGARPLPQLVADVVKRIGVG